MEYSQAFLQYNIPWAKGLVDIHRYNLTGMEDIYHPDHFVDINKMVYSSFMSSQTQKIFKLYHHHFALRCYTGLVKKKIQILDKKIKRGEL